MGLRSPNLVQCGSSARNIPVLRNARMSTTLRGTSALASSFLQGPLCHLEMVSEHLFGINMHILQQHAVRA